MKDGEEWMKRYEVCGRLKMKDVEEMNYQYEGCGRVVICFGHCYGSLYLCVFWNYQKVECGVVLDGGGCWKFYYGFLILVRCLYEREVSVSS